MSACHSFVPEYQFPCLMELIKIVRAGELGERRYEAIQHGSWFIGCAAAKLDESPSIFSEAGESEAVVLDDLIGELEVAVSLPPMSYGDEEPSEIDPMTIITIIGIVIRIISALRK